jgi:uncharacterized Tic20 family protein
MKESYVTPTQEEKLLAALAHGSILVPTWGLIIAAVVWITQRGKSVFVERQARQATTWQVAQLALSMVVGVLAFATAMLGFVLAAVGGTLDGPEPPLFLFFYFPLIAVLMLGLFSFIAAGIWAAVRSLQGRDFVYPLVGARVERYLAGRS